MAEECQLKALRLVEQNPKMTQRELAQALGVSVGAANYCLKALVEKGWVKLENFQKPQRVGVYIFADADGYVSEGEAHSECFTARNG